MFEVDFTPTERTRIVRQGKAQLRARVNGNLTVRFTAPGLTSFAGLELVRRFLRQLGFSRRLRRHLSNTDPAGDYSSVAIVRLMLGMMMVGARRLWHVRHLVGEDRKSTRLNSSHGYISYAVFCFKKKNRTLVEASWSKSV